MATRWTLHVDNWKNCTRCALHSDRQNIVLASGAIPCDIAFVGEAPGNSEDSLGEPFVGPAGDILKNDIIDKSIVMSRFRILYTNLLACIPLDEEGTKVKEPPLESIKQCKPRLIDLLNFSNPQLIVAVGTVPYKWLNQQTKGAIKIRAGTPVIQITHPAFILRQQVVMQPLLIKQQVITLREACEHLEPRG